MFSRSLSLVTVTTQCENSFILQHLGLELIRRYVWKEQMPFYSRTQQMKISGHKWQKEVIQFRLPVIVFPCMSSPFISFSFHHPKLSVPSDLFASFHIDDLPTWEIPAATSNMSRFHSQFDSWTWDNIMLCVPMWEDVPLRPQMERNVKWVLRVRHCKSLQK